MSDEVIVRSLTRFILEVWDKSGEYYKSDTLYELIMSLQIYFHMHGHYVKFLDDDVFIELHNTLNNHMKYLASQSLSCPRQKAEAIEVDDECTMWQKGVLGDSNPKQLVDTVLYLLGTHFALRAGKEHKALRVGERSQLAVKYDHKAKLYYLECTEDTSKTNQGGLKHCRISRKLSRAYENAEDPECCIIRIYRKYMALRPSSAPEDFYLRPLMKPKDNKVWYYAQAMGINTLGKTVSTLMKHIGLQGHFTNHSHHASAASCMYQSNCDEQLVMEKTGHHSNAVRLYKRMSDKQLRDVSKIIYSQANEMSNDSGPSAKKVCTVTQPECELKSEQETRSTTVNVDSRDKSSAICLNLTINVNK